MKMLNKTIASLSFITILCLYTSCEKDFLNVKPDKALVVPTSFADFRALMDNENIMNSVPALGSMSADEYYLTDALYTSLSGIQRNAHVWNKEVYDVGAEVGDWNTLYQQVLFSNVVLEGLEKIDPGKELVDEWNMYRGSALFYRAHAFYQLATTFAKQYSPATLNEPGIPLRLSADINLKVGRGTVEQTYSRIVKDLLEAVELLPVKSQYTTRPNKVAALALMARVSLNMLDYPNALKYSEAALQLNNKLIDYNTLNSSLAKPISGTNDEVIFYSSMIGYSYQRNGLIPMQDYNQYHQNDLRRATFFTQNANGWIFKGTYTGNLYLFGGISVNELYLIKAECLARAGSVAPSLETLNTLLRKRWKTGTFTNVTAADASDCLNKVLAERKKELIFRVTRWTDLKRLNTESQFARILNRTINGQTYSLAPNDKRYALPIPDSEIVTSGIAQNDR